MPIHSFGMSYRKVLMIIVLVGAYANTVFTQIGTASSNLLASFNAYTLPENLLEFEPTYTYSRSLGYFNPTGEYVDRAGVDIGSSLYFRATYGVSDIVELGAGLTTELDILNLSAKVYLIGNDHLGFALMGGINSDITSGSRALSSLQRQYILGIASHYIFSDALSVNASLQYQDLNSYQGSDIFFNSEVGYYVNESLLTIAGFGWSRYSNSELPESVLFSLFPGFAIERPSFAITFQGQFDITGINIPSTTSLGVSFTLILE